MAGPCIAHHGSRSVEVKVGWVPGRTHHCDNKRNEHRRSESRTRRTASGINDAAGTVFTASAGPSTSPATLRKSPRKSIINA